MTSPRDSPCPQRREPVASTRGSNRVRSPLVGGCFGGGIAGSTFARAASMAPAAAPGVVLHVADGIVRIVVHVSDPRRPRGPRATRDWPPDWRCSRQGQALRPRPRRATALALFQLIGAGEWDARSVNAQETSAIRFPTFLGVLVVAIVEMIASKAAWLIAMRPTPSGPWREVKSFPGARERSCKIVVDGSKSLALFGERGGNRTHDPLIKSQMLYLLSYALASRVRRRGACAYSVAGDRSTAIALNPRRRARPSAA